MASKRKRKKPLEKAIQKEILGWLATTGLVYWRQNAGFVPVGGRMVRLGLSGLPDIFVVMPPSGLILGLEVKRPGGKLRPSQVEFKERLLNAGGEYKMVTCLDEAKAVCLNKHWIKHFLRS